MTSRIPMLVTAAGVAALLIAPVRAQYGVSSAGGLQLPFENNRVRITQLSVAPGCTQQSGRPRQRAWLGSALSMWRSGRLW